MNPRGKAGYYTKENSEYHLEEKLIRSEFRQPRDKGWNITAKEKLQGSIPDWERRFKYNRTTLPPKDH